jgi:hypothetical protein
MEYAFTEPIMDEHGLICIGFQLRHPQPNVFSAPEMWAKECIQKEYQPVYPSTAEVMGCRGLLPQPCWNRLEAN